MGNKWKKVKFGDEVLINPSRRLQKRQVASHLSMEQLSQFQRKPREHSIREFTGSGSKFQNDDTLLARITPCLENGKTVFVDFLDDGRTGWGSTEFIVLTGKDGATDPLFVYYLARSSEFREFAIRRMEGTSGRQRVPAKALESYEFLLPSLKEQQRIAEILGSLDDKIELNRRMNETLEAMARRLFKSWFVDFDPVQAKARVRREHPNLNNAELSRLALPNMAPEIAELFPDTFEDSALGPIPKGWRVGKVADVASKTGNGGTPKRSVSEYWEPTEVPWLTSGEVRQAIVTNTEQQISKLGLSNSAARLWPAWTTVVALYGATAGHATITSIPLAANQACCGLQPRDGYRFFQYITLSVSTGILAQQARGSAQQNLSKQIVEDLPIVIPAEAIAEEFESKVSPMFETWVANLNEATNLAITRDKLLPRLLAGELETLRGAINLP